MILILPDCLKLTRLTLLNKHFFKSKNFADSNWKSVEIMAPFHDASYFIWKSTPYLSSAIHNISHSTVIIFIPYITLTRLDSSAKRNKPDYIVHMFSIRFWRKFMISNRLHQKVVRNDESLCTHGTL